MLWSYDGQIKRYVTQLMRLLSNFPVKDGKGNIKQVPVTYGNLSRQVGHILKDNSENKLPSAPRIAVYITDLQMDRDRLTDSTYTHKVNIRERKYDRETGEYLNEQGSGYTVERLIPTPYTLKCSADIWTTNTDQKLQLLEQILVWFNPSLEIQTTDNFIDWTSITVVDLEGTNFSNNSVPIGVDSEIEVSTLNFTIPIYISTPAKVKKMGVITNIITSIHNESLGDIENGVTAPEVNAYDSSLYSGVSEEEHGRIARSAISRIQENINYGDYPIYVSGEEIVLETSDGHGIMSWEPIIEAMPGEYIPNSARIFINNYDSNALMVGNFVLSGDGKRLLVSWDMDSMPSDTVINGPTGDKTTVDYIIDPQDYDPRSLKFPGVRFLILSDIGSEKNKSGPAAWKNSDGSDTIATENSIIEWDGNKWSVVFSPEQNSNDVVYTTNLNTQTQYKFLGGDWRISVDGSYPVGTWRIELE